MQQPPYSAQHRFPRFTRENRRARRMPVWPVIGIFLILLFQFITAAAAFLMPVTLAVLLFFVFAPFRRVLSRYGVRAGVSAAVVTLGLVMLVGGIGYSVSGPINEIVENSPGIAERLEDRFQTLRESVRPIEEVAARIDEVTDGQAAAAPDTAPAVPLAASTAGIEVATPADQPPKEVKVSVDTAESSTLQTILNRGPSVLGQMVFTLLLLFFLLASGDLLYLKVVQSFDSLGEKRAAYMALREIEAALGSYLGAITLINAVLGLCIGLVMWLWGMPQPLLWGVAGFLLNFIPYLGSIGGVAASFLVALISFDDIATPIFVALSYLALTAIEGQLITPYSVSRRLQLNTVVVFVTVALWAWLWSVLGMVVAVPMLVVLKVIADHIPGMEKLGNFLAGEPPPALDDSSEAEPTGATEGSENPPLPAPEVEPNPAETPG